mgnify:CR=1 FL=1
MTRMVKCVLLGIEAEGLDYAPYPGELGQRIYENQLRPLEDPKALLADHPEFVQPVEETRRFEAPPLDLAIAEELDAFVERRIAEGGAPTDF